MTDLSKIAEHMDVVGSDGQHVGTVDHVDGARIKLTKTDRSAGGEHHFLSADLIASVDDKVRLSKPASEVAGTLTTS